MIETTGLVTIGGIPVTLLGRILAAGQKAPDFTLLATDFKEVRLSDSAGRVRLLSVCHSLETPVCDWQTQRFEAEAARFKKAIVYSVSMDLPFAQARYSSLHDIRNLRMLSDYRDASFGFAYGVLIRERRLLSRAIFVIDGTDIVRYAEYAKEVEAPPDYARALESLKKALEGPVYG